MDMRRLQFKKLRIILAWMGAIVLVYYSHSSPKSFLVGVPIVLAGEGVRLWASGYIERKGAKLATNGPFAYSRNPLYVGNFLMGLGIVVISRNVWLLVLFLIGFGIIYRGTIKKEEKDLEALFGDLYRRYLKEVPRIFPRLTPYPLREKISFQWELIKKHREYVALLSIPALIAGLYLWEKVIVEKKFGLNQQIALAVALIFFAALVLERLFRDKLKARDGSAPLRRHPPAA